MKKYLLLICLLLPMLAFADTPRGEKLTNMLWRDIQTKRIKKIGHYTSKQFQGANPDQILKRSQELQALKEIPTIDHFQLSEVETTQGENVITVTYLIVINFVPINGNPVLPSSRRIIDVWKKDGHKWKWASEATATLLI